MERLLPGWKQRTYTKEKQRNQVHKPVHSRDSVPASLSIGYFHSNSVRGKRVCKGSKTNELVFMETSLMSSLKFINLNQEQKSFVTRCFVIVKEIYFF